MGFYDFLSTRSFQVFINLAYMFLGIPMTAFLIIFPLYLVILGFIPTESLAVSSAELMFLTFTSVTLYLEISFISRLLNDYLEDRDFSDIVHYIDRNIEPETGSSNGFLVSDRVDSIYNNAEKSSTQGRVRSLFSLSKPKPLFLIFVHRVSVYFQYFKLLCALFFPNFVLAILFVKYFDFSLIELFWEVLIITGSLMFVSSLFFSRFLLNLFDSTMINTNSPLRRRALGESYTPGSLRGLLISFSVVVLFLSLLFSLLPYDGSPMKYVILFVVSSIGALPLYLSPFFHPFHTNEEIFI